MIRAVFKEWGGIGWALTSTSALLTWSAQLWWPFWIAAVLAGGFTAFMFFSCVLHVRDERTRILTTPPDPIAEMVTFKAKRRAQESREWADQFAALTGATVPDAYAPPDELHNRALCPCVECTVYRLQRPTAVLAAVPGVVGRMRGSIEQYRNPAYGTKPSEPMYILPSSIRR